MHPAGVGSKQDNIKLVGLDNLHPKIVQEMLPDKPGRKQF